MQRAADSLRFATYGYSGLFDQVKMRDEELDRLYRHDEGLIGAVAALEGGVRRGLRGRRRTGAQAARDGGADRRGHRGAKNLFNAPA